MMIDEDRLSTVLSEFARTMVTDFPVQAILERLVERIVDVLPVTGAGVTVISPGAAPYYVAASDQAALVFERLQTDLHEGPCRAAWESGTAIAVPDLARDKRFPQFAPAAAAAGLAAVFTFPLRHGSGRIGALDLYRDVPGSLVPKDMAAAQTLADVAATYLLNAQAREQALQASERYRDGALHDALTGLANRLLLKQRLEHAALRGARSHGTAAVLFADLDRFKRVNDNYGHAVGDELLIAVAQRLSTLVRPGDTLARVSGDEFVLVCEDLAHIADVEHLAFRIDDAFAAPFVLGETELSITASVGIAFSGPGEAITPQLVLDADSAMYRAKRRGGAGHHVLDLRRATGAWAANRLEDDLRSALVRGELDVAYQPIVRLSDGLVTGAEALVRWTHPLRGDVPAATLVAIAEDRGLVGELGRWVLQRACADRAGWARQHPNRRLQLSVNVSALQLDDPAFPATVASVLAATDTPPEVLLLEVTETVLVQYGDRSLAVLGELKALGVKLALDDFGTGFCSLSYLRRFPVDTVKIDRSFVTTVAVNRVDAAIVAAVTQLAHVLGLTVVAEGVEERRQREAVTDLGCDYAQGFLYAAPMTSADLVGYLASTLEDVC